MKKLLIYLQFLLLALTTSCQDDVNYPENKRDNEHTSTTNEMKISIPEAINIADAFFGQIDNKPTRTSRTIRSLDVIVDNQNKQTRATADTLFYLFNYEQGGFAVISADKRMAPILAISTEGNFALTDTLSNSGLALFVDNLNKIEANMPNLLNSIPYIPSLPNPIDPTFPTFETKIHKDIKPLLKHHPRNWAQHSGFNKYCPNSATLGVPAYVGCVPLACSQIMSYFEWPTSYNGITLDWSTINSISYPSNINCPDWLAQFLYEVGTTLKAKYDYNGKLYTSVSADNIQKYFSNFGYSKLSEPISLTHSSASSDLESAPLLVVGNGANGNEGHCWVIDGYLSYTVSGGTTSSGDLISSYSLYHCVWGWGGSNNGYFLWRDGTEVNTSPYNYEEHDKKESSSSYSFTNLKYFRNFEPLK